MSKSKKPNRRTVPIHVQVAPEVGEAVRRFAEQRGESLRHVVESALRRHMANPPPYIELLPLPPVSAKSGKPS